MSVYDSLPNQETLDGFWSGVIATNAASLSSTVEVIINSFGPSHRFGPCKFMARGATPLPVRGNTCLVGFDERQRPYVIAWWP